jgi:hypothetical protein
MSMGSECDVAKTEEGMLENYTIFLASQKNIQLFHHLSASAAAKRGSTRGTK